MCGTIDQQPANTPSGGGYWRIKFTAEKRQGIVMTKNVI